MESDFDTTGIITKISDDFSVVTVTINDIPRSFSFSKYLLYVFGLQCEGQVANILDEGMEVQLRYKLSNDNVPSVVAVWISKKPDHLCENCALKPFYGHEGKVIEVREDNVLVQIDGSDHTVLVSKEVFFRNGYLTKNGSGLVEGEAVEIDAIPFEFEHPTGASYQATCAWVGHAPVLVDRYALCILGLDDPWDVQDPMEVVHGTVTVIPNEVVAFAECVQHNGKVLLFRSSFAVGRGVNIKDLINIGDSLCMRIRYECLLDGSKQLYAAQAWKDGCEGDSNEMPPMEKYKNVIKGALDNLSAATEAVAAAESESVLSVGDQSDGVCSQKAFSDETSRKRRTRRKPKKNKIKNQSAEITGSLDFDLMPSKRDDGNSTLHLQCMKKCGVLFNDPPLSGIISIISQDEAYILYNGLMIYVDRKTMFKDGKPLTDDGEYMSLVAPGDQKVFFEAVERHSKAGFTHQAICVWVDKKPSLTLRMGKSPEHRVKTNLNKLSQTKIAGEAVKVEEAGDVLIGDPALSGPITLTSKNTAYITYQGYKIFVRCARMYVDGQACDEKQFVLAVTTACTDVNFEAVRLSPQDVVARKYIGFTYEATCAWMGRKPFLLSRGSSIWRPRWPEPLMPKEKGPSMTAYTNTEVKFNVLSPVLYREDLPLEGILKHDMSAPREKYMSFDSVYIVFGGLKIFLDCDLMYYKGKPCPNETILDLISRDIPQVNFEAVKTSDYRKKSYGYSHEATCVWVGQRPGLLTIARTLPPMRFDLLKEEDRTYRGVVIRFCLPKVALVYTPEHDTIVSLHVSVFGRKPRHYLVFVSGKDCISTFVKLNDVVEFKATRVASFACVLSAIDVKVVSTNTKTSGEALLNCSYPEKSTASTKRGTPPRVPNPIQKTKQGMPEGLWSRYPQFETSSVRKEAPVEAKFTNQDAEKEVMRRSFMESNYPEVTAVFDKALSEKGETVGIEAKEETENVSVLSSLAERSPGFSNTDSRFESSSVRKEVLMDTKLTDQEAEKEMSPRSSMGSNYPKVTDILEEAPSDKEKTVGVEAKGETTNVSVPSPLTERSCFSPEDIPMGVDALSEEKRHPDNFGKVSGGIHPLSGEPALVSISNSEPPQVVNSPSFLGRFRFSMGDTGATRWRSRQPPKRSPESSKCSVM